MKLFTTKQIPSIDKYTIDVEPVAAIDLMERAARKVAGFIEGNEVKGLDYYVFCGPGNNGGDGLAVARMLASDTAAVVNVFILDFGKGLVGSAETNFNRLKEVKNISISFLSQRDGLPEILDESIIVDALFGSGLNRPLEGLAADLVKYINAQKSKVYSIDIPSGLMGEDNGSNNFENIIRATYTVTFQFPKISFHFPENEDYVGVVEVADIGLHSQCIVQTPSRYFLFDDEEAHRLLRPRSKFSHKGTFGHALLIAGSYAKTGAAILGAKACLRSGVGLLTVHLPHTAISVLNMVVPEAMASIDDSDLMFTSVPNPNQFSAVAVGPGIGQKTNTRRGLKELLTQIEKPMVLDADALNLIADDSELLATLPEYSVLTPHPKEFARLTGAVNNGYQRMLKAVHFAQEHKVIVVVKGANTMVVNPEGDVWWNTTGNPGMATAGSGDTLTGIILALLAQGYTAFDSARLGVYVHGLAGDIAAARRGFEALVASDISENLGEAFKLVHK